ncbi:MAG: hypothetical protein GX889_00070 [Clostridiales bacterium]|nr:hypothetical protein [Clostridiales bacterium]
MKALLLSVKDFFELIKSRFNPLENLIELIEMDTLSILLEDEEVEVPIIKMDIKDNNVDLFTNITELMFDNFMNINGNICIPTENTIKLLEKEFKIKLTGNFEIFTKLNVNSDGKEILEDYISFEIE